jgi:hypothetical protein
LQKTLRPLFLIREKETDEDLLNMVIPTTDHARAELATDGVCATVDGQGYDGHRTCHNEGSEIQQAI